MIKGLNRNTMCRLRASKEDPQVTDIPATSDESTALK